MKLYAIHDEVGNIRGMAIPADEVKGGSMGLEAEPGQFVSQIDVDFVADEKRHDYMNDLSRNYQVDRSKGAARLLKKKG